MRKRGLCGVCLSVMLVDCIHTAEDIVKIISRPGSPFILVLCLHASIPIPMGNPFSGGAKYKGWENFAFFDGYRRISQKRYEIGPWLLWNVNRKSHALYRMVTFSMTLMDPNPVFTVTAYLKSNISKTVRLMDKVPIEH